MVPGKGLLDGDLHAGSSLGSVLVVGQRERLYSYLKKPPPGVLELERVFIKLSQIRARGLGFIYVQRLLVGGWGDAQDLGLNSSPLLRLVLFEQLGLAPVVAKSPST